MTCYPHVSRKVREARSRLHNSEFYESTIEPAVKLMHMCHTKQQFEALSNLALKVWRDAGEDAYAQWFQDTYCGSWGCWYMGASGFPGAVSFC